MTNIVKLKNLTCIEWTVDTCEEPDFDLPLSSDYFTFQDRECRLVFEVQVVIDFHEIGDYILSVYFESDREINPPVEIITQCTYGDFSRMDTLGTQLTGCRQKIWSTKGRFNYDFFTFNVIILSDPSEETQPQEVEDNHELDQSPMVRNSKMNSHLEALSKDFSKLFEENLSCDVKITCGDKTFNAHKIVLEARSSVFSAMLNINMVESETGLIKVKDFDPSTFQSFLRYLYSGILPKLNFETAKQFYEVGDKYNVDELRKACSEFLKNNLSANNALELLVLADQHSDEDFRNNVISYIVDKKLPKRDSRWADFCSSHSQLAIDVLNIYIQRN